MHHRYEIKDYIKNVAITLFLVVVGGSNIWAADDYPAQCRVTTNLNVRSCASKSCQKIGLLHKDEYVTVNSTTGYGSDQWGMIDYGSREGYISMRYVEYSSKVYTDSQANIDAEINKKGGFAEFISGLWKIVKWIFIIIAVLLVLSLWEYIIQLAVYAGFFAGVGAILFNIFGGSGGTGAIVGLVVALLVGVRLLFSTITVCLKTRWNGLSKYAQMSRIKCILTVGV